MYNLQKENKTENLFAYIFKHGEDRLNYTKGVDVLSDTIEAALHFGLIDNSTQGTFKIIDPETGEIKHDSEGNEIKIRGKLNVSTYFNEHLDEWKALYDAVYEKIKEKESPYHFAFEQMLNSSVDEAFGDTIDKARAEEEVL